MRSSGPVRRLAGRSATALAHVVPDVGELAARVVDVVLYVRARDLELSKIAQKK